MTNSYISHNDIWSVIKSGIEADKTDDRKDKVIIQPYFHLQRLLTFYNIVYHRKCTTIRDTLGFQYGSQCVNSVLVMKAFPTLSPFRVKHDQQCKYNPPAVSPQPGKSLHSQICPLYYFPMGQQSRNSKIFFNDLCAITLLQVYRINTCPRTNCC